MVHHILVKLGLEKLLVNDLNKIQVTFGANAFCLEVPKTLPFTLLNKIGEALLQQNIKSTLATDYNNSFHGPSHTRFIIKKGILDLINQLDNLSVSNSNNMNAPATF